MDLLDCVRTERARVVSEMQENLASDSGDSSGISLLVGYVVVVLVHTWRFISGLLNGWLIALPRTILVSFIVLPVLMLYAWIDGMVVLTWYFIQLLRNRRKS